MRWIRKFFCFLEIIEYRLWCFWKIHIHWKILFFKNLFREIAWDLGIYKKYNCRPTVPWDKRITVYLWMIK